MNGIYWNRIVGAAAHRTVAVPGELAGYLLLGVSDALQGQSGIASRDGIRLEDDGQVTIAHVTVAERPATDRWLRELLSELLEVCSSTPPALQRVARPAVAPLAASLLTALIPVNRAAARRALARLHRELRRSPLLVDENAKSAAGLAPTSESKLPLRNVDRNASECTRHPPTVAVGPKAASDRPEFEPFLFAQPLTLLIPPVAPLPRLDASFDGTGLGQVAVGEDEAGEGAGSHRSVRETTLVIAPVAPKSAVENTLRLEVAPGAMSNSLAPAIAILPATQDASVLSPSWSKPPQPEAPALLQEPEAPALLQEPEAPALLQEPEAPALLLLEPVEPPLSLLLEPTEPTMALPLVTRRYPKKQPEAPDSAIACQSRASDLGVCLANWDATAMDSVVEVTDDEISYHEPVEQEICVTVDGHDAVDFAPVIPPAAASEYVAASALDGAMALGNVADKRDAAKSKRVACGVGHDEEPWVAVDDLLIEWERVVREPSALADECSTASNLDEFEVLDAAAASQHSLGLTGEIPLTLSDEIESVMPNTLYRPSGTRGPMPRTSVDELTEQFPSEPLWTQRELCRTLRVLAGVELSPAAPIVQTLTPPPAIGDVRSNREHVEPTRRLRRVGSVVGAASSVPDHPVCGNAGTKSGRAS